MLNGRAQDGEELVFTYTASYPMSELDNASTFTPKLRIVPTRNNDNAKLEEKFLLM